MTGDANRDQYNAWNGENGQRWVADADRRDSALAPIGDLLIDNSNIHAGDRILDIGCGCGATTLAAATRVGTHGHVVGLDLSEPMLSIAEHRALQAATTNVAFVHGDAQTHQLEQVFDHVISRFGTMFFDDPIAAFTNIARDLAPDGRVRIVTWQPLEANEWLTVPGAALLPYASAPDLGQAGPGMFAQSDPETIRPVFRQAGLGDTTVTPHTLALTFGSTVEEAVGYLADAGPGRALLDTVPPDRLDEALASVRETLADHVTLEGVQLDAAVWIIEARTP